MVYVWLLSCLDFSSILSRDGAVEEIVSEPTTINSDE